MSTVWNPLLEKALRDLACSRGDEIAPGSSCTITEGPEVASFADDVKLDVPCYHAKAILRSNVGESCGERSFLLPSSFPKESLDSYRVVVDDVTGIFHVASRYRYVSFKELLELRDPASPQRSRYLAEFSNGAITAIPRRTAHGINSQDFDSQLMGNESLDHSTSTESSQSSASVSSPKIKSTCSGSLPSTPFSGSTIVQKAHSKRAGSLDDLSLLPRSRKTLSCNLDDFATEDQRNSMALSDDDFSEIQYRMPKAPSPYGALRIDEDGTIRDNFPVARSPIVDDQWPSKNIDYQYGDGGSRTEEDSNSSQENDNDQTRQDQEYANPATSVNLPVSPDPSCIQALPSFPVDTDTISRNCDALDIVRRTCSNSKPDQPLVFLDLASPSMRQELADAAAEVVSQRKIDSRISSQEQGFTVDVDVPGDDISQAIVDEDASIAEEMPGFNNDTATFHSNLTLDDIDEMFNDDDDDNNNNNSENDDSKDPPNVPTVLTLTDSPVFEFPALDMASKSLGLRPHFSRSTDIIIEEIHKDYVQIWTQAHPGLAYHFATYDDMAANLAFENFETKNGKLQAKTVQVVQQYITAFLRIWCGGHPHRPEGRWVYGEDDSRVSAIAVELVEWEHMVPASEQIRDTICLRPGSMVFAESSSSSDWYLKAVGGDSQYSMYRRNRVGEFTSQSAEVTSGKTDGLANDPVHHINFNGSPIYKRSKTPPEVSFWAASTTCSKVIFGKQLPNVNVHYAKVIAGQAFKFVDPTKYLGDNINELWRKQGSAMRDAATSDVKVVYSEFGIWNQDSYKEDDWIPDVVPANNDYEFATNGSYHYFQVPYIFNMQDDENLMFNINEGNPSEFPHCEKRYYNRERPCNLIYELGEELAKKAASLEDRPNESNPPRKAIMPMETVVEEASDTNEDTVNHNEEDASEADTDIPDGLDLGHEPFEYTTLDAELPDTEEPTVQDHVSAADPKTPPEPEDIDVESMMKAGRAAIEKLKAKCCSRYIEEFYDDISFQESEPESFDGDNGITDHNSTWPSQLKAAEHPKAELLARFSDKGKGKAVEDPTSEIGEASHSQDPQSDTELLLAPPEDGRYASPSKMALSRIDEIRTPIQSPTRDEDFGSWELNEFGAWATPGLSGAPQLDGETSPGNLMFATDWEDIPSEVPLEDPFVEDPDSKSDNNAIALMPTAPSVQIQAEWSRDLVSRAPQPGSLANSATNDTIECGLQLGSRLSQIPSIPPIAEAEFDVDNHTPSGTSKKLVLYQKPKLPTASRSWGNSQRPSIGTMSDFRVFSRSLTGIMTEYGSTESSNTHSRCSSSSEPYSYNSSTNPSRSTSVSEPPSDVEIQGEMALQVEAKQKGLKVSIVANQPYSPPSANLIDLARAEASLSRTPGSVHDMHASRKDWAGLGEMKWENAAGMTNRRAADAAKKNNMRAGHVNAAPAVKDAAEMENGDAFEMKNLESCIFGPLIFGSVAWLAWKAGKVFWRGLWA